MERSARRIDAFADHRGYADATESCARLSLQNSWESGEDTRSEARVRLRIDLPWTRERLRLFVEGGDPDDVSGEGADSIPNALDDDPDWDVDRYYTRIRARLRAYETWLFVELRPELLFREEDDYDASFRFSLRVDILFGERYR